MSYDADVIIIGAGGGGSVVAKELGELGINVLVLEAGPWYGNKKWLKPNSESGGISSSSFKDLDKGLLDKQFTDYEADMNDLISGKLRWGPADRRRSPWFRNRAQIGPPWQSSGVGGTTQVYWANSPRALPRAVDNVWPIPYQELIPYYQKVEATLPVHPAPMTAKEELFFYGCEMAGYPLIKTPNLTIPGYRPQPAAILRPDPRINDPNFPFGEKPVGCTLRGHCVNGCHIGPSVEKVAKRSTLVSYIPLALKTGIVKIMPNSFATRIITENHPKEGIRVAGVQFRNTWSGEFGELKAKAVVMAAGAIETPRLWLNSALPPNPWVGKGLTNHWFDVVSGIFDEQVLMNILGIPEVLPFVGQTAAARFDYPGLGTIENFGMSPGLYASMLYALSQDGYSFLNPPDPREPWDLYGKEVGERLKFLMSQYRKTLSSIIFVDDEVNFQNGITLDPVLKDEHGPIPLIRYSPSKKDKEKRDQLARIAADFLRKAGAKEIIRADWPTGVFLHLHSTMRLGYVTDTNCEAYQVKRLFIADNSVLYNSIGGPNPTLTTQALATRTVEKMVKRYFS
ncbi:MAG: GMC family oxidoreductase N-terminal domain-containing protein [Desulfosporosinus sp.]|nr:GMC family oxidoreductase N-terminal domain-containing protein [Desulfosporosinus sp.]